MTDADIFFYLPAKLIAIHSRHHYIAYDNVGLVLTNYFQSFLSIRGSIYLIEILAESAFDKIYQFFIVINYQ